MLSVLSNPLGIVEAIGAFYIGYFIYQWLKNHPKLVHLDDKHLFLAAALPIGIMLLIIGSNWLFVFALLSVGWIAMTIMVLHIVLFIVGFVEIVNIFFAFRGSKKKTT